MAPNFPSTRGGDLYLAYLVVVFRLLLLNPT